MNQNNEENLNQQSNSNNKSVILRDQIIHIKNSTNTKIDEDITSKDTETSTHAIKIPNDDNTGRDDGTTSASNDIQQHNSSKNKTLEEN